MKINSKWIIIIAIIVIIAAIGGYAIYQSNTSNSNKNKSTETVNNAVVTTKNNSTIGNYLADPNGNTLYIYNTDVNNVSNCTGSCLQTWPAYIDTGSTTNLPTGIGTITRSDNGKKQYTYNGMPLYYFVSDSNGQVTGNGVNNFQVAAPSSTTTTSPSTTNNSTQSSPSYNY